MSPVMMLSTILFTIILANTTISEYVSTGNYNAQPPVERKNRHKSSCNHKSSRSKFKSKSRATITSSLQHSLSPVVSNHTSYEPQSSNYTGNGKIYKLAVESAGAEFFDDWDFFSDADPTHGMVDYQTSEQAWKESLVSVGPSSLDQKTTSAKMKVDDTTWLASGQHRKSVRLSSKKAFKYGLVVLDAIKMPFGCSTWPAFWTVGDNWPLGGEIDIVEGVNMLTTNQMTLHTASGCNVKNPMGMQALGRVLHTNCDAYENGNAGCGVADTSDSSYGQPFNANGGGIFVMEWTTSGISIWRFNRGEVPQDLATGHTPQPSSWSHRPLAHWSNNDCNHLSNQFSEHRLIFDITLCGDWAGASGVYNQNGACSGSCSDAIKDPKNFHDAHWEVASVKLYQ